MVKLQFPNIDKQSIHDFPDHDKQSHYGHQNNHIGDFPDHYKQSHYGL